MQWLDVSCIYLVANWQTSKELFNRDGSSYSTSPRLQQCVKPGLQVDDTIPSMILHEEASGFTEGLSWE